MASESIALNLGNNQLWVPFKSLHNVINKVITHKDIGAIPELENMLKLHKSDFICLLQNPALNVTHREVVKKACVSGINIVGQSEPQIFPSQLINEALLISDMLKLNEINALELLIAGQQMQSYFPGLTRGLVSMLLYYDGRCSLVNSLRFLVQASEGRSWTFELTPELSSIVTNYTNLLKEEGLVIKIIDLIDNMNVSEEMDLLQKNRALGGPRYRKQVEDLIVEIKQSLAEVIFCWACQNTLSQNEVERLIAYLSKQNETCPDGTLDKPVITLSMALLYVMDVSCLQTCDEQDPMIKKLNLIHVPELITTIHKSLSNEQIQWKLPGLKALFQFAWSVSLRTLAQFPAVPSVIDNNERFEDDERMFETALNGNAMQALNNLIIKNEIFHQEEFFLKRIHNLITDFIILMPVKVKDMRNRGDESAKIISAHIQEGLEAPTNLPLYFQHFLLLIANVYENNPLNLDLALEYWCPMDNYMESSFSLRPSQRQVALYKFVRMAGDLLPSPLFVPYHKMLKSLASSKLCAHHCFNLLKLNSRNVVSGHYCIVSWDHFFKTLHNYFNNLREEVAMAPGTGIIYRQKMLSKGITQQEVEGLCAVLDLIAEIVELDEVARLTLVENSHYTPLIVLLGLITCSISSVLKASLIRCLAAFGSSSEIAMNIWQGLYSSQIIPTVQSTAVYHPSGILTELEDVESRREEYPVTLAVLKLINTLLSNCSISSVNVQSLPGLKSFIEFIKDKIFLKNLARVFKNPEEKYQILTLCLQIFQKVLQSYQFKNNWNTKSNFASPADFHPGFYILSEILKDGGMLRTILNILDEGVRLLDIYNPFKGKKQMEESVAKALSLLYYCLTKQQEFMQQIRETSCDLLVTSLDNLLMGINPRTGEADHFHNIMKYVTYNTFIPQHSLWALRILLKLCSVGQIAKHLISIFDADPVENDVLLHGFVEILEVDITAETDEETEGEEDSIEQIRSKARVHLLMLLLNCLRLPGINIAHYLLGFNVRKPLNQTEIQEAGVMGSRRTCLHAVLTLLDTDTQSSVSPVNILKAPRMANLAFQLIYTLCSNVDTSGPVLRYLRSTHDFFYRHLQFMPYKTDSNKFFMLVQSWFLKALAIELRVTSAHHQRSHVQRLLQLLLEDKPTIESGSKERIVEPTSGISTLTYSFIQPNMAPLRRKLMLILDTLDFKQIVISDLQLEYFDTNELPRVFENSSTLEPSGVRLINTAELNSMLKSEIATLHNTSGFGQRSFAIQQEMTEVLKHAKKVNESRLALVSKVQAFSAWRQVVEIILIACPLDMIGQEKQHQLVLEITQELIRKVISTDFLPDLMAPVSGIILILMSALRHSIASPVSSKIPDLLPDALSVSSLAYELLPQVPSVANNHHSSLLIVLKAVVECLLQIGSGVQRVRANFYTALLNLLNIVQKPYDFQSLTSMGIESSVLGTNSENRKLRMEFTDALLGFGEMLMEVICRDACTGHDITKMLALTFLDVVLSLDTQQQWLAYIVSKGYLRHLLGSLRHDDEQLQNIFNQYGQSPVEMKFFYVFQSKMALLIRIGNSTHGALALLRNDVFGRLSDCQILDSRPDVFMHGELLSRALFQDPHELMNYYHQILSSMMKLIITVTTALGLKHKEVTLQILGYVSHKIDFFLNVLRNRSLLTNEHGLEELALVTAVLARTSLDDPDRIAEESLLLQNRGQFLLLRQHLLAMLPLLVSRDNFTNRTVSDANINENSAKMKLICLQITSHILNMCCSTVIQSVSSTRILFEPSLSDVISSVSSYLVQDVAIRHPTNASRLPNLGLLVSIILQYSSQLPNVISKRNSLLQRLQSVPTLTSDELAEYLPNDVKTAAIAPAQRRQKAKELLLNQLQNSVQEIGSLSYILECSSFILLRHLEFFIELSKTANTWHHNERSSSSIRSLCESRVPDTSSEIGQFIDTPVNKQEVENFKAEIATVFTDNFFHKLQIVQQHLSKDRSHVSFLEAITNRIKRLVKLKAK